MVAAPFRLSSVIRSVLIAPKRWSKAIRGSRRRAASDLNSLSTLTGQVTHDGCGTVQVVFGYQIGFDRSQAMVQGDKGQPQACGFRSQFSFDLDWPGDARWLRHRSGCLRLSDRF